MAEKDNKKDNKTHSNQDREGMSVQEAGRKGGETTRDTHGEDFYSEIGQKQGKENNPGNFANRDPKDVAEAGRRGGESRGHNSDNNNSN